MVDVMNSLQHGHDESNRSLDDSRHSLAVKIQQLEAEIDALVYRLYGLTDEEIALVESKRA